MQREAAASRPVCDLQTITAETAAAARCASIERVVWIISYYPFHTISGVRRHFLPSASEPTWDLEVSSRVTSVITTHSVWVSGSYVTPKHRVFAPCFSTLSPVVGSHLTGIKTKPCHKYWWSNRWGRGQMFRVKLKAEHVGLEPPSYIWGRRWKIDGAWRLEESPSDSASPPLSADPPPVSLVPNEQQLARLTDYVAFLENWNGTSAAIPLSLCRLKFGQTPIPLPAKTPFPITIRDNKATHPSTCLCLAHAPPRAADLNSLSSVRR